MRIINNIFFYIVSIFITISLLNSIAYTKCKKQNSEIKKFKKTIKLFYKSIEQDDAETRIKLFTKNAIMMPDGWKNIKGIEAISKAIKGDGKHIFKLKDIQHIEISLSGDTAYTVNKYYYTYHEKGKAPNWKKTKNVHIWKKQKDGSWKLHIDIWNSSW